MPLKRRYTVASVARYRNPLYQQDPVVVIAKAIIIDLQISIFYSNIPNELLDTPYGVERPICKLDGSLWID